MMLRTLLLIIFLLLISSIGYAQQDLGPDLIEKQTSYFTINNGEISGADSLLKEIEESQFIALGELHNRQNLSHFSAALLDTAASFGFQYFAVETGSYSAEKLEQLIADGPEQVSEFYDEYSYPLFGIVPIPFFTGQADLEMLQMAKREGYDLWGIDQEFAFSPQFLINDLANAAGNNLTDAQRDLKSSLGWDLYWMQFRAQIFSSYDLACTLRDLEDLQVYLDSFDADNPEVASITNAMMKSLGIYCMYESGNYRDSNQTRIAYFKSNFDEGMNRAMAKDSIPKVILKMGSYHAGRERSPLNYYDIGNHVQQWADSLNTQSFHIRFLNRYIEGEDMMESDNYTGSRNFMAVGKIDRWAMIDLRPLRQMLNNGALTANEFETREINNYDVIVIMPNDTRVERHY